MPYIAKYYQDAIASGDFSEAIKEYGLPLYMDQRSTSNLPNVRILLGFKDPSSANGKPIIATLEYPHGLDTTTKQRVCDLGTQIVKGLNDTDMSDRLNYIKITTRVMNNL